MIPDASWIVTGAFVALPLLVAGGLVAACEWAGRRMGQDDPAARRRRAWRVGAGVAAWLALTALVAAAGFLRRFDATPPPFAILIVAVAALGPAIAFSPLGTLLVRGLPLWALVGFQAFRLPLEIVLHRAHVEGLVPVQMCWSGRNYDVLSGTGAAALGLWLLWRCAPRWVVAAWNALGLALLANIVVIAVLSTPIVRFWGDDRLNTFVADVPFVWLPAVLVAAAWTGHLLVWRRLARGPEPDDETSERVGPLTA